jgi:hypothetical protein
MDSSPIATTWLQGQNDERNEKSRLNRDFFDSIAALQDDSGAAYLTTFFFP